jgi:hypothetical protein
MQANKSNREDSLQTSKIQLALQRHAAYVNAVNQYPQYGNNQRAVQARAQTLPIIQASPARGPNSQLYYDITVLDA